MKLPDVVGLTLCDSFEVRKKTGQACLVGVFQGLHFTSFPSPKKTFTVYSALYGGVGEGTMELEVFRQEQEVEILRLKKWLHFPGPALMFNFMVEVTCAFPTPGNYSIVLRIDDEVLTQRFLPVFKG